MSQPLLTRERSFWRTWRRIAYLGLDDPTEERLLPASLEGFSKMKRLLLLTSDSNELQTLAHIRTTQTAISYDSPGREPLTTKRSTERMAIMLLSERHLSPHDRMEAYRFSLRSQWKVKKKLSRRCRPAGCFGV